MQQTQSTEDVTGSIPPSPTPPPTGGILLCDWIEKLSLEIPAVAVFFFDLDWNHPQWSEKVTECASKVQVIRCVGGRNERGKLIERVFCQLNGCGDHAFLFL